MRKLNVPGALIENKQKSLVYIISIIIALVTSQFVHAQCYKVGVLVCDTVGTITSYGGACQFQDDLSIKLDSTLIPFVSGLKFMVEITAIKGSIWSNLSDTLNVGDRLPLPAPVDSGALTIILETSSSFEFITTIVGTPTVANEKFYADINDAITLALCNNALLYYGDGQLCEVQSPSSINIPPPLKAGYRLSQNYPNPFNPETSIKFSLPKESFVKLAIYNVLGQKIRDLIIQYYPAGEHTVVWDGRDDSGKIVNSGVYLFRIKAGDFEDMRKLTFMK